MIKDQRLVEGLPGLMDYSCGLSGGNIEIYGMEVCLRWIVIVMYESALMDCSFKNIAEYRKLGPALLMLKSD